MRTFLGALMLLIVSGDDTTIGGVLEDSVLLPCTCSVSKKDFRWQRDETIVIYKFNETLSNRYKGRTKTFMPENSQNCSVLLTNITVEDQGEYTCSFQTQGEYIVYKHTSVHLNVSASYNVCQTNQSLSGGVEVFQCIVSGRYREAWIQWTLDGEPLINTDTTNITHTDNTDALAGLYHFHSTLSTKLNWTSKPTCNVKAKNISTTPNLDCSGSHGRRTGNDTQPVVPHAMRYHWLIIIPIMLVLGLSLLLLYFSRRLQRKQEVNTNNVQTHNEPQCHNVDFYIPPNCD